MRRKYLLIIISVILTITLSMLGGLSWLLEFAIVSLYFFFVGVFYEKILKYFSINIIAYFLIVLLPSAITTFIGSPSKFVYPILISPYILLFIGFIIQKYSINKKLRFILVIIVTFFIFITAFIGMPNYFAYLQSDNINIHYPDINYKTKDSLDYKIKPYNRIVVIDFWTTTCGICYRKFPKYNELVNYYTNMGADIDFYAICLKTSRDDFHKMKVAIEELDYNFNFLIADSLATKILYDSVKINGVPHFLVINNNEIVYSGSLNTNKEVIIGNMYNIIDKLEKEK